MPNVSYCEDNNEVHYIPLPYQGFCKLTLNDGSVVELEGSGQLVESMVNPYKETLVSAEIGELCTSITNSAFHSCSGLTSVTVGNNVTTINNGAFYNCSSLTSVTIPSSVTTINNSAFQGCSSLSSIGGKDSNASVKMECINTYIGEGAFQNCSGLTTVSLPNGVTTITNSAFSDCSSLTEVTIPSSVTNVGVQTFRGCSSLTSIISLATTAPTIFSETFRLVGSNGILTVPSGSSGYDTWMGTGDYYLGKYGWTKVEQ